MKIKGVSARVFVLVYLVSLSVNLVYVLGGLDFCIVFAQVKGARRGPQVGTCDSARALLCIAAADRGWDRGETAGRLIGEYVSYMLT
jgi:hypothetical protein